MSSLFLYACVFIFGVLISSCSQVVLKKTAVKKHDSIIKEYLNLPVICSYVVFVMATFCTMYAYKGIPLSMGPILESTQYLFIAILSYIFLKEHITKRKAIGIAVIIFGVILYAV